MSNLFPCAKCDKKVQDTKISYERYTLFLGKYYCVNCVKNFSIPLLTKEEDKTNWDNQSETKRNAAIDYLLGVYFHMGIRIGDQVIFTPKDQMEKKLLDNLHQFIPYLVITTEEKRGIIYRCQLPEFIAKLDNSFPCDDYSRIPTDCKMSIKNNESFFRGYMDNNYRGKPLLTLYGHKCILDAFTIPPVLQDNMDGLYEYKWIGLQLQELIGTVYSKAMVHCIFIMYMSVTYPKDAPHDAIDNEEENADNKILRDQEESLGIFIPDTPLLAAQRLEVRGIEFKAAVPEAILPTKAGFMESGFDLTLIRKVWEKGLYTMYDTGIICVPPPGICTLIIARSSIYKTEHSLANSVGLIDQSYRGTLKVILKRDSHETPELKLPAVIVQLVPIPAPITVGFLVNHINDTTRGSGGFGSTTAVVVKK
jgi:dUTPase